MIGGAGVIPRTLIRPPIARIAHPVGRAQAAGCDWNADAHTKLNC
jgi:hypothetical protein